MLSSAISEDYQESNEGTVLFHLKIKKCWSGTEDIYHPKNFPSSNTRHPRELNYQPSNRRESNCHEYLHWTRRAQDIRVQNTCYVANTVYKKLFTGLQKVSPDGCKEQSRCHEYLPCNVFGRSNHNIPSIFNYTSFSPLWTSLATSLIEEQLHRFLPNSIQPQPSEALKALTSNL